MRLTTILSALVVLAAAGCKPVPKDLQLPVFKQQVKLYFATLEEATAYAKKEGWRYTVELSHARHVKPKAYADNFAYNRIGRWTH